MVRSKGLAMAFAVASRPKVDCIIHSDQTESGLDGLARWSPDSPLATSAHNSYTPVVFLCLRSEMQWWLPPM